MSNHDLYMANRARVRNVIEGLRLFWPYDALNEVRYMYGYGEFAEAISIACAYARWHGYGTVQDEMLALANEYGEHDFTAFSPHPYEERAPREPDPVEEVPSGVSENPAGDPGTGGGERPAAANPREGAEASGCVESGILRDERESH